MRKKKNYQSASEVIIGIVVISLLFVALYSLSKGSTSFSAYMFNENDELIHQEILKQPKSVEYSQSFFSPEEFDLSFLLMSSEPVKSDDTVGVFKSIVENPFNERAELLYAIVSKNGKDIGGKNFVTYHMRPTDHYTYKTDPIELIGRDAQINTILIEFFIESDSGERVVKKYQYDYYSLTQCVSDDDCESPNNVCDKGNMAGFSTEPNVFYCTRPCSTNGDCYENQVCKKGYCGY